jgi:hypothetical protein
MIHMKWIKKVVSKRKLSSRNLKCWTAVDIMACLRVLKVEICLFAPHFHHNKAQNLTVFVADLMEL